MKLTEAEKLEAYELAAHQLINAMNDVRHWVRLAETGVADLMEPAVLKSLRMTVFSEKIDGALIPLVTYKKRQVGDTETL
jgi:hypothetical protein